MHEEQFQELLDMTLLRERKFNVAMGYINSSSGQRLGTQGYVHQDMQALGRGTATLLLLISRWNFRFGHASRPAASWPHIWSLGALYECIACGCHTCCLAQVHFKPSTFMKVDDDG